MSGSLPAETLNPFPCCLQFLSRPFVVGEQVVLSGGPRIEGIVEGVEIMRTLVRTNEGVVVAVPNKVSEALCSECLSDVTYVFSSFALQCVCCGCLSA